MKIGSTAIDLDAVKPGDIVYLRSGGGGMTVDTVHAAAGLLDVVWFNDDDELQRATLSIATLCSR